MVFLDESAGGVASADVGSIARALSADAGRLAGFVLASFAALALLLEPPLLRLSERVAVRWALGGAIAVLGGVTLALSFVESTWTLLALVALYGPASGVACASAEGTLVESNPSARERTLTQLTFAGALGDLAVPLAIAAIGWRASFRSAAVVAFALAAIVLSARALLRRPSCTPDEPSADGSPPRLRDALRQRALLGWTIVGSASNLMDEVALAFIAVHVQVMIGSVALAVTMWTLGGIVGPLLLDRLLERVRAMRLLAASSALALAAFAIVIFSRTPALSYGALFVLGACASCFHPLVKARAYASLPGHPGVVNAVAALFAPVDLLVPLALGLLAGACGSHAALGALACVVAALTIVALRSR